MDVEVDRLATTGNSQIKGRRVVSSGGKDDSRSPYTKRAIRYFEVIVVKTPASVLAKRDLWARDAAKAWDEYLAAPDITAAKTARLRQARLERDAAGKAAAEKVANDRARLLKNALMTRNSGKKSAKA